MELRRCNNLGPVQLANELAALQQSMNTLIAGVGTLETSIHGLIQGLKADVEASIQGLITDVEAELETSIQGLITDIEAELETSIQGLITDIEAELETNITNTKTELEAKFTTELEATKTDIQLTIDDCDFNNRVRAANKRAAVATAGVLRPLRNTTTHQEIRIPETLGALNNLTVTEINSILSGLGQRLVLEEHKPERLTQLKQFIGVEVSVVGLPEEDKVQVV
ncbi:hypothetical protein F4680DRAFT_367556 [Xylaria scruposa]|nr:hypothetical protein F4680DRAFT_367556 [Xylaria scruposa]